MMNFSFPCIRYASDMPFATGMVLADDCGATVEVLSVGVTHMVLSGWDGHGIEQGDTRLAYPYLVFVTEMVADAEARAFDDAMAEDEAQAQREWDDAVAERLADEEKQLVADREFDGWVEEARVEALAAQAQWEDDMRQEVLDIAAAEWKRKNPPSMRTVYEARSMNRVEDFDSRDEARAFVEGRGVGSVTTFVVRPNNPGLLPSEVHNSCAHDVFADGAWRGIDLTR